jgi:hypothetical protein
MTRIHRAALEPLKIMLEQEMRSRCDSTQSDHDLEAGSYSDGNGWALADVGSPIDL